MSALEWKNFKLGCCYIFSFTCLCIYLLIRAFTDTFCASDVYEINHIALFFAAIFELPNLFEITLHQGCASS